MTLRLFPSCKTRVKSCNPWLHNPLAILQVQIQLHPSQPFGCSPLPRHGTNDSQIWQQLACTQSLSFFPWHLATDFICKLVTCVAWDCIQPSLTLKKCHHARQYLWTKLLLLVHLMLTLMPTLLPATESKRKGEEKKRIFINYRSIHLLQRYLSSLL